MFVIFTQSHPKRKKKRLIMIGNTLAFASSHLNYTKTYDDLILIVENPDIHISMRIVPFDLGISCHSAQSYSRI